MTSPRFSIGIDLGTTNSALAFVPLDGETKSEILGIPQWQTLSGTAEASALPSFIYLPEEAAAIQIGRGRTTGAEWIVGRLARKKAGEAPGRVVHSAKSWLCHHTSDRTAQFLPWGSDDIARTSKISPIGASAIILRHFREAWNSRFADSGPEFDFDRQDITVTVPASFDAAAQRLTLIAAQEAGFPDSVRLLEEPQAAFYSWLKGHDFATGFASKLPNDNHGVHHVLVVDIGGGTSDFSLFALRSQAGSSSPDIKREAVGDHILLGGDNVDLAIARLLEPRLIGHGENVSGPQWDDLVARCRDVKEAVLSHEGRSEEIFSLTLPGRGSGLIAGSRRAQLTRAELLALLLDGFFPECSAQAYPYRTQAALKEWGLPYAADCAVTRHLAAFLRDRPRVDAILFNGGALRPMLLRQRICRQVEKWQRGLPLLELENTDPEFTVARGAALFGSSLYRATQRIEAGAARAVFLEVLRQPSLQPGIKAGSSLICVLPRGAPSQQRFEITGIPLELQTNRVARFQAYSSSRHNRSAAGDIVDWSEEAFQALPPLQTVIQTTYPAGETSPNTVRVTLVGSANELGLLQVYCVSADPRIKQSWPLEFNLRPRERDTDPLRSAAISKEFKANVAPQALGAAQLDIRRSFSRTTNHRDAITATRVLKKLEQILGMPKSQWNAGLVRSLWAALESCMAQRNASADHEEAWLILAGFLLRPGFGAAGDDRRIDSLWRLRDDGLCFPGKRVQCQEYILWRRLAGGLTQQRQEQVLARELDKLCARKKVPPELIRLAGSLERLPVETKTDLAILFIDMATELAREKKHCAPYLAALGHLLSRASLYAGPEAVVSPDLVERAYESFRKLEWGALEMAEMPTLFLRAARVVGDRGFDLPKALRHRIAAKLENLGIPPQKTAKLKEFVPVGRAERIDSHDESLPPGLVLTGG